MVSIRLYRLVFFLALTLPACVSAQDFSDYNWYFGQGNTGLRFSRSDNSPSVVTNKGPLNIGGSAVVSYPTNGNLFFYTNGVSIFDASHQPMPGPALTGGSTTRNQAVAVCQNPAASNQYFIFANNGAITVSVVDSALVGNAGTFQQPPLGAVASTGGTIPGMPAGLSEAMIILADPNGDDFWLITHRTGTTEYHFAQITNAGPTYRGSISIGSITSAANFSYHAATNRIAVSPQEADRAVELLTITFPTLPATLPTLTGVTVINTAVNTAAAQAIYDTEFSPNGQFLYVSVFGEGAASGDVLQYDLTDLVPPTPTAVSVLPSLPTESYGLQMGPDSVIYHLYQSGGSFFLGALTNTDSVGSLVNYNPNVFPGNFGGRQFPSFAPADSLDLKVYFEANGLCATAPTAFFPTVSPGADSLRWNFGDNTTSSQWSPVHTYEAGGDYQVRVTAFLNGQQKDTVQTITVNDFDLQISLVQDTIACSCELPFPKAINPQAPPASNPCNRFTLTAQLNGTGNIQWQWFGPAGAMNSGTGNSAQLQPDSAGYYYLVATVAGSTCSTHAGVNIQEYNVEDRRSNFWYFGQNAGINFNPAVRNPPGPIVAVSNPVMNAPEGTSIICDRNGQVVIFTDGSTVWRRDFSVVATNIGGDPSSTQSSLIVPVAGDETLYYIFTTQQIYGSEYRLSYSLFDLKLNNGTGGMRETNVLLFQPSTERITSDGNWILVHEYGNNSFRAYRVGTTGISNPVISSIGSDHTNTLAASGKGYMELGPQGRLAVALSMPAGNFIEVFNFDGATGVVSDLQSLSLTNGSGQVYGLEFNGRKLFATLSSPGSSRLYEFAFDYLGVAQEVIPTAAPGQPQSATVINEELGAIQAGPDGQVYVAVNNKPYLGTIQVNGDTLSLSTFTSNSFPLQPSVPTAITNSTLGLPNFINSIANQPQTPFISFTGICLGDSTVFAGSGTSNIDTLTWAFGDGGGASGAGLTSVNHLYASPGTYSVTLSITNRCVGLVTVLTTTVTIHALPTVPAPSVGVICDPAIPVALDANPTNVPNLSHVWNPSGQSTQIINVTRPGVYEAINTDVLTGCSDSTTFTLFLPSNPIDLGLDQEICSGTPSINLNTGNNINSHVWSVSDNGGPYVVIGGNNGPIQATDFTTMAGDPTIRSYAVQWQDVGGSNCFVRDTITFTINQSPVVGISNGGDIACGATNGTATITLTQPTTGALMDYTLFGPAGFTPLTETNIGVPAVRPATGLIAGTYIVEVTDQVTGCIGTNSTIINTTAFTVDNPAAICNPSQITMTTSPAQTGGTYRLFDGTTNALLEQGTFNSPQLTTNQYAPGNYIIEVTNNNCTNSAAVVVTQNPTLVGSIDLSNICALIPQITAQAAGATSFDWSLSDAGSVTPINAATVTVNPGNHTVRVTIDDGVGNNCPVTVTQTVAVDNFDPDFTFENCTDAAILVATATNASSPLTNYIYNWSGPVNGTGQQLSINASSGSYTLSMRSTATGCPARTVTKQVDIAGPLTVDLDLNGTPCDGGVGFSLIATPSRPNVFVNGYTWSRDGNVLGGQTSDQLSNLTTGGLYVVTATDGACDASAQLDIFLLPSTPGELPSIVRICPEDANPDPDTREAILDPGDGFLSYDWFELINGGESTLGVTTQTYTTDEPATYGVLLENVFNCFSKDYSEVVIECEPVITGPNAFRPTSPVIEGGLSVNQTFRLITFFLDEDNFQIYIYSRWGELVYQSDQLNFAWNGGYNNNTSQLMPAGTYTWVARYKSVYRPDEGIKEKRGGILLLR